MENKKNLDNEEEEILEDVCQEKNNTMLITADALSKFLKTAQLKERKEDGIIGFPIFDPDHSRVDIIKWCSDIDTRIERDNLKDFDVLPRVRSSLMGRSKAWFDKYGYQHYSWSDLRSSIIHAFSSGTDIVAQLRKVANSESKEFGSYSDFVMEKVSQINRLPFEVPEDKIVKIIIGCITNLGLKNSLMFVMPTSIQCLIDHLSSISEPPRRQQDASVLNDGNNKRLFKTKPSDEDNFGFQNKRPRLETEKKCFKCGKVGHLKANCPRLSSGNRFKHERLENVKICSYCNKAGHEERTCWSKQNADQRKVNLCNDVLMADNTTDVFINGRLYHCLLDTGSDCSLLRADIANQMSLKRVAHFLSIQGISKHPILLTEKVTLLVEFEKLNTEITFYIIEEIYLKNEIIIGRDVLSDSSLEIRVDMHGSTLQRKDHLISSSNVLTKKICEATPDQNFQVESLLNKYSASIVKGFPVTEVQTGSLNIRLNQEVVVNYRPYRMAFSERTVVSQIISELKSQNIVRDSSSPFASPIVLVKKKNGQHRLCVDYRALNRATVKDRYPLPRIEDQLDRLSGNKYFTSLDMASGFHQIPIEESSIEKTAFVTPDGHFEYLRMPFGLANAPAVFQRAINKALGTLKDKTALVYMDDVLIPSSTVEEGIKNLDLVLKALTQSGFSLNIEKCKFLKTEIEYLGREVSVEGIRPGKSKIEALVKSIPPANVKQVRQFMGLSSYFRKFVPEFAVKTRCISALTKNDVKFNWTSECEEARQYIIRQLTNRPVLVFFDPNQPTELHTDASALGYGAILFQRINGQLHVVAYYSQSTKLHEEKYHSYELETLAVVNAVKNFRNYLLGIRFTIVTDCNALKATKEKKDLLSRVARWWIYLQDFEFNIIYRKGKTMQHADYLSRNPPQKTCYQLNSLSENWLNIEQYSDVDCIEIIEKIKGGDLDTTSQYVINNGLLYRKIQGENNKLLVPQNCRLSLMRRYHEDNCHIGWEKTLAKMKEHFWMPRMSRNVRKFVESCLICLVAKRPSGKKQCELHPIEKKPIPFHTIHIDCMGPFHGKDKEDNRYILIFVDAFTKFVILFPCKTLQAKETIQHLNNFVMLFGVPAKIISDKGTNFTSEHFQNLCTSYGIEHHTIAPGISRANGQVERYVDTVANLLRTNLELHMEWTSYVSRVQLALNTTINKTTGLSPLKVLTGISGRTPEMSALFADLNIETGYDNFDALRELADKRIRENAGKMKTRFDKGKCTPTKLEIGATVLYKSNQIRKSKLDVHFKGLYEVIGVLPNDRYKLKKINSKIVIVAARETIRPVPKEN